MDDDAPKQGPTTAPGWFDDPFSRDGQRWWDGKQWTGHARAPGGASLQRRAGHGDHPRPSASISSNRPNDASSLGRLRPYTVVIGGVLATLLLVGLLAPSAEDAGVVDLGSRRAAYGACVDLIERQLPPTVTAAFYGHRSATVLQSDQTWQVAAVVGLDAGDGEVRRPWACTVVHDDGTWHGIAELE